MSKPMHSKKMFLLRVLRHSGGPLPYVSHSYHKLGAIREARVTPQEGDTEFSSSSSSSSSSSCFFQVRLFRWLERSSLNAANAFSILPGSQRSAQVVEAFATVRLPAVHPRAPVTTPCGSRWQRKARAPDDTTRRQGGRGCGRVMAV